MSFQNNKKRTQQRPEITTHIIEDLNQRFEHILQLNIVPIIHHRRAIDQLKCVKLLLHIAHLHNVIKFVAFLFLHNNDTNYEMAWKKDKM